MRVRAGVLCIAAAIAAAAGAQGTKLWTIDRYDDLARGASEGVAIRSDGRLEAGPVTSLVAATGGSYVWAMAADAAGNGYAGVGGTASGSAAVLKVTPEGTTFKIFEGKELAVQAIRPLADGMLLAATSPEGKVYRIPAAGGTASIAFDPAATEEKPKYIWDVAEIGGILFVATGAPAAVYRLRPGGKAELLFHTADQHIRCLLAGPDGTLWAGSDGAGVIYRIRPAEPGAKPFAVYAAPRREVTALALDPAGNLYAVGVGAKGPSALPPLPVTGAVGVSITFVQPGSATAAGSNAIVPEGSEIYRIAPDGAPSRLLALKDDVVYALAVRNGALLAATGNRGRVYKVDTAVPGRFTDVAHLDASQGMAFAAIKDGLLVATSNSGKVFKLRDRLASPALYTSPVFDAQGFAEWGRAEVRSDTRAAVDLYARSGNVESPLMGWTDWLPVAANAASVGVPAARFVQWKAVLREAGTLDAIGLNYLQANIAPVIDEVIVQPGARVAGNTSQPPTTVQVSFPAPPSVAAPVFNFSSETAPLTAQKDRSAVTVRWAAHDDNGDDLMFAIFYKGGGERNWRLLKDKITDRFYSFDASLLPDGSYTLKVVASDAPVHTDAEAKTTERVSDLFVIDTTPPIVDGLHLDLTGAGIRVTAEARDATSVIAHAEYSLDAGPWQYVVPTAKLSDSTIERYTFTVPLDRGYTHEGACSLNGNDQHIVALRVYDRYDNIGSVKGVVDRPCGSAR